MSRAVEDGTVQDVVRAAVQRLRAAGVASPRPDAETLLAHVLGVPVGEVRRRALLGRSVSAEQEERYVVLVRQRAGRVPVQHLTGTAPFGGVDLQVGPGVFVPRPETEVLLGLALQRLGQVAHPVVVDLCTGSGALAIAVQRARPTARVHAVELSTEAYAFARRNVAEQEPGVVLELGPAQEAFPALDGRVDVVTCNPPYIPPDAVPVDPEVREHDPGLALYDMGGDGLRLPMQMAQRAGALLRPGGHLLMEHADVQGDELVARLSEGVQWRDVLDHPDLTGRPRVVEATRRDPDAQRM